VKQAAARLALVLACAAALLSGALLAPAALRTMEVFHVVRVELVGSRHLDAATAAAAAGITTSTNLFDDPVPWRDALLRHPLVAEVEIERRIPDTIVLHVRESIPVALARTPELRPVDEAGRVLPMDPSEVGMDLPVFDFETRPGAGGHPADEATRRAARFIGMVRRLEPALLGWISEVGMHGDAVRLVLRSTVAAEVLVMAEPSAERLAELHYTLADLATSRLPADSTHTRDAVELARVQRIDGRFHDQIVVALHRGKN
jgi:cell division protein FtsQ